MQSEIEKIRNAYDELQAKYESEKPELETEITELKKELSLVLEKKTEYEAQAE